MDNSINVPYKNIEQEIDEFFSKWDRPKKFSITTDLYRGDIYTSKTGYLGGIITITRPIGELSIMFPRQLPRKDKENVAYITVKFRKNAGNCDYFHYKPVKNIPKSTNKSLQEKNILSPGDIFYGHISSPEKVISTGRIGISSSYLVKMMIIIQSCDNDKISGVIKSNCAEINGMFELENFRKK